MKWYDGLASVIFAGMAGALAGAVMVYVFQIIRSALRAVY